MRPYQGTLLDANYCLNLLGGAALHGRNGPVEGRAAHRRRVALLAILAAARGRAVGRERILGLLWPDHNTAGARHLLSESLYVLRKELGSDAFVSSGDEVGLNGGVVRSDVEAFEGAVEAGELEGAARLYRGPFLDGFFVADAPEFERWAEGERARLAHAHVRAVECLAIAREGEGRHAEAAEWWRRLMTLDPYNSRVGTRLMAVLDAAGERAAALWFAETHTAFLREELGVEPDDDFQELVDRLRTEPVRVPQLPVHPPASGVPPAVDASVDDADSDEPAHVAKPGDAEPLSRESRDAADDVAPAEVARGGEDVRGDAEPVILPPPVILSDAPPTPSSATPPVRRRRRLAAALAVLVAVAAAVAVLLPGWRRAPEPPRATGYDPRRIAVLYFDDHSRGGELGYLANGLTEMLIHELSQVEALDVVSRNGVKQYRHTAVPFDSLVSDLRVGSVVEGSVQRSGSEVRITVQLVDAANNSHLESRTVVHPMGDVFAMEDALADSVSGFLRRRLGEQVRLRRMRGETRSSVAWRSVMEAEAARDDAARLLRTGQPQDATAAAVQLARADSLLATAERADPRWARPTVLRGWVAHRAAPLAPGAGPPGRDALAFAERALAHDPRNALARELRGTMLFARAVAAVDGAAQAGRIARAEADLRAAVAAEPGLAGAWGTLSQLLRFRGRFAESDAAARRALAEDAYLDGADALLHRLFFGSLMGADYAQADSLCRQGGERFRGDWKFVECRLILLRADPGRPPDTRQAARLLAELDRVDPPDRARREGRAYSPHFRQALAAAVAARAGDADSARAMLARARGAVGGNEQLRISLAYDAAYVHRLLGEPDSARALLAWAVTRRPSLREYAARDPLFRGLPLPAPASAPKAGAGAPPRPTS